ncbi:NAD-binding protein, partial [Cribrihabitans sp. XS_ASV171]
FAPEPGDQLFVGDQCYVFSHVEDVDRTMEVFGKIQKKQERVVIVGGGNVGLAVARSLEEREGRVRSKIIERDRRSAERAAEALERTIVLHGDGLDASLLGEAGISRADAMLAVTDDDKTNLLAAVRAKSEGCPLAIALINDPTLVPM